MNLSKLFEIQRELDEQIEQEHPRQEWEDRLAKKILALQVELGELANELPEVFKFWSNKKNDYNKALVEYCDCLHFFLSIGNELGISKQVNIEKSATKDLMTLFAKINRYVSEMWWEIHNKTELSGVKWFFAIQNFLRLGEMLGYTWEQVEQAYMSKNAENHARQKTDTRRRPNDQGRTDFSVRNEHKVQPGVLGESFRQRTEKTGIETSR